MSDFVLILSFLYCLPFSYLDLVLVHASEKPKKQQHIVDYIVSDLFSNKKNTASQSSVSNLHSQI